MSVYTTQCASCIAVPSILSKQNGLGLPVRVWLMIVRSFTTCIIHTIILYIFMTLNDRHSHCNNTCNKHMYIERIVRLYRRCNTCKLIFVAHFFQTTNCDLLNFRIQLTYHQGLNKFFQIGRNQKANDSLSRLMLP